MKIELVVMVFTPGGDNILFNQVKSWMNNLTPQNLGGGIARLYDTTTDVAQNFGATSGTTIIFFDELTDTVLGRMTNANIKQSNFNQAISNIDNFLIINNGQVVFNDGTGLDQSSFPIVPGETNSDGLPGGQGGFGLLGILDGVGYGYPKWVYLLAMVGAGYKTINSQNNLSRAGFGIISVWAARNYFKGENP